MKLKKLNFLILLLTGIIFAQGSHGDDYFNPDSLETISVSGITIVDSQFVHPMYYLDINGDQIADYHLNFGPYWYQPDSSAVTRPQDGEQISITGGLHSYCADSSLSTIVVYEISDEFWRDPYESYWNNMGGHTMGGGHHQHGRCGGYTFGFNHDSLETIELSGVTYVDSTFLMLNYYLDVNNDSIPNYFLNFGPPWYEPESGAVRPESGEEISLVGGIVNDSSQVPMIIVYEINGQVWRDSNFVHNNIGKWMSQDMSQNRRIHNPFDQDDWIVFSPGWHTGGGMGHHMMPDSVFVQMMELLPGSVPNSQEQHHFAGYEMGFYFPNGQNGMGMFGGCGSMMQFNNQSMLNFHYTDYQINANNINEDNIRLKYWDEEASSWVEVEDATVDKSTNTVSISESNISPYYILTGSQVTSTENDTPINKEFTLYQNYPNPFNPTTNIVFSIPSGKASTQTKLIVYDMLGQEITTLLNKKLTAGNYEVNFDGKNSPSGIYFYQLTSGNFIQTKKMVLIK